MRLGSAAALVAISIVGSFSVDAINVVRAEGESGCIAYEYPVQVYRTDARRHTELYGLNRFASLERCEQERAVEEAANAAIVSYVLRLAPKARIKKWNFGQCRCDRTTRKGSPTYLDQARRETMIRIYEQEKYPIEWEADDKNLNPQSEIARNFRATPRLQLPSDAWPLVTSVPEDSDVRLLDAEGTELMPTTIEVVSADSVPTLDHLELIEVDFDDLNQSYIVEMGEDGFQTNPFIAREIGRIETQLPAAFQIEEPALRDDLVSTLQQRLQMLANLDRIIGTVGESTALARETSTAAGESESLALIRKFFGETVREHWAPENLTNVVFDIPAAVSDDPVAILRSTEQDLDPEMKRLATYVYLMRTPVLTENEELWLAGIMEEGLSG